jgi:NTE family protein
MSDNHMAEQEVPARPASYDKKVALVLQGGGALGSYQAGVYEALSTSEYLPDWVAAISIGAINAAIIAGNAPEHRVERLKAFWGGITAPSSLWPILSCAMTGGHRGASSLNALMFGQPGFFSPRPPIHWLLGPASTSYYDTSALKATLERLVDFDRINAREIRFSVGAVNVRTGNFAYFDNAHMTIRPEHVMASGALPPGFPAVEIDGECYWDGGLVSNTPLQYVVEYIPRRSRLTFQVDLFHASGRRPANLEEVGEREKDIRYSSRTRAATDMLRTMHDVRHNINNLWDQLPENLQKTP